MSHHDVKQYVVVLIVQSLNQYKECMYNVLNMGV